MKQDFQIGDSVLVCTGELGIGDGVLHSAVVEDRALDDERVSAYFVRAERKFLWFRWTKRIWVLNAYVFGKSSLSPEVNELNRLWRKQ